ncbi:hypothetical protein JNB62_13560 [Microbacterium jejuense]|uniref:Uncharacterized protein n=1 Tax=Microbacterium jejuense TaxID=1263637 RepID=A0ABS7HP35_9MICO|nr:DUF6153 family protein [Microbacterium jejuense]MBW9094716.1 hypothetical protein [Microbacterium jejuense]
MPHPHVLLRPRLAPLVVRLALAAAIIAGLLGMHVMMTPSAHAAHATSAAAPAAVAERSDASHHDAASAVTPNAAADATVPAHELGPRGTSAGWAVACVLALLLTVLVAARPLGWWPTSRRAPVWTAAGRAARCLGPRHPSSLIALCISRT